MQEVRRADDCSFHVVIPSDIKYVPGKLAGRPGSELQPLGSVTIGPSPGEEFLKPDSDLTTTAIGHAPRVSLREFSNNAFNQHHGIQSTERFGIDTDPDGDGFKNEMPRAEVTAVSVFQAAIQVPGRVIPRDPEIEHAVFDGERLFDRIGCASCHIPRLPLDNRGWIYSEPNPCNPPTNLRLGRSY